VRLVVAMKQVAFGIMGLGFLMLLASVVWVSMFSTASAFSKEKAERWGEVKDKLHNLAFIVNAPPRTIKMHKGQDIGQLKVEYEALKKEDEQLKAEFSGVYDSPRTTSKVLRWGGISLAVIGLVGWYAVNQSN
jgi:hypothetical protein